MNASLGTQTGLLIHSGGFLVLNSIVDQKKISPRLCRLYLRLTHSRKLTKAHQPCSGQIKGVVFEHWKAGNQPK